jgi:hypothetical protein
MKNYKGVIFSDKNLIVPAYPYTHEYKNDSLPNDIDLSKYKIFKSFEGCLLRLYFFEDKWYLSTNRKINAFNSRWSSSISFGKEFLNALYNEYLFNEDFKLKFDSKTINIENIFSSFTELLDKNHQYVFLLLNNTQNRIVCKTPSRPTIYHVGTFIDYVLNFDYTINIPFPEQVEIDSLESLKDYVNKVNIFEIQGLILINSDSVIKVYNDKYIEYFKIRNNCQNILYRYVELRVSDDPSNVFKLKQLYPEYTDTFSIVESKLREIAQHIHKQYIKKFIKKQTIDRMLKQDYYILKMCHKYYIDNKYQKIITLDVVMEIINKLNTSSIYNLVK